MRGMGQEMSKCGRQLYRFGTGIVLASNLFLGWPRRSGRLQPRHLAPNAASIAADCSAGFLTPLPRYLRQGSVGELPHETLPPLVQQQDAHPKRHGQEPMSYRHSRRPEYVVELRHI